jgi:hypothetical protein
MAQAARKHRAAPRPRHQTPRPAVKRKTTSRGKPASKRSLRRARPPQTFNVSHHHEQDFKEGLRSYAKYRDLGMSAATGGMVQAHCRPTSRP